MRVCVFFSENEKYYASSFSAKSLEDLKKTFPGADLLVLKREFICKQIIIQLFDNKSQPLARAFLLMPMVPGKLKTWFDLIFPVKPEANAIQGACTAFFSSKDFAKLAFTSVPKQLEAKDAKDSCSGKGSNYETSEFLRRGRSLFVPGDDEEDDELSDAPTPPNVPLELGAGMGAGAARPKLTIDVDMSEATWAAPIARV